MVNAAQAAPAPSPDAPRVSTPKIGILRQRHVDAHAGFERAQLLEPLALLERGGRQCDEPLERGAAIRIEPDVVIERPLAATARWRG